MELRFFSTLPHARSTNVEAVQDLLPMGTAYIIGSDFQRFAEVSVAGDEVEACCLKFAQQQNKKKPNHHDAKYKEQ